VVYSILFRATADTLRTIAADPQHLGAAIGFVAVLHTWGQTLMLQRSPELTQGCSPKMDHSDFPPMTRASRDAHEAALRYLPSVVCAGSPRWPSPARVCGAGLSDRSPRADAGLVAAA
jgi:hypothetical protein